MQSPSLVGGKLVAVIRTCDHPWRVKFSNNTERILEEQSSSLLPSATVASFSLLLAEDDDATMGKKSVRSTTDGCDEQVQGRPDWQDVDDMMTMKPQKEDYSTTGGLPLCHKNPELVLEW